MIGSLLGFCEELVDSQENLNFELSIAIIGSVVQIDSFSVLYRSLCPNDGSQLTLLKITDGIFHSIANENTGFNEYQNTSLFMIELLNETIDGTIDEKIGNLPDEKAKSKSLKLFYILQFWSIVSEGALPFADQWAEKALPATLTSKLLTF